MSSSIGIITREGVVVASDSRQSVCDPRDERTSDKHIAGDGKRDMNYVLYHVDGASKVWAGRYAAATWMSGNLEEGFLAEFAAFLTENDGKDADELSRAVHRHLTTRFFQVLIAGYTRTGEARLWLIGEEDGPRNVTQVTGRQFMYALGRNEGFIRLFGDVWVPLEGPGSEGKATRLASTIDPEKITLQAAVDFSIFYLELVQQMEALKNSGHQCVGGPVDVAVVTARGTSSIHRTGIHGSRKTYGIHV